MMTKIIDYTLAALLVLTGVVMAAGCSETTLYRSIATSAYTVSSGYRALDHADEQKQTAITIKAVDDKPGARAELVEWLNTYNAMRKILEVQDDVTNEALREAPLITGIISDRKSVQKWIGILTKGVAFTVSELQKHGVITGGK